jgi:heme-degrading monooxygenase HmoA
MRLQRVEVDPEVPLSDQLSLNTGPATLFIHFRMEPGERDAFLEAWRQGSSYMKRQEGFMGAQMHQGIGGSRSMMEVAIWETTANLRAALSTDEWRALVEQYPRCTSSPQLFQRVAVPDICPGPESLRRQD